MAKEIGYRTEAFFGEGYRNAASVMAHETFVLGELPTDDYVGCGFCEAVKRLDGRSLAHDPL